MDEHVAVVGAGPAGLAAAWAIRRAGLDPLVVEQADAVAASWRGRHDHLRLNTHRMFSHQPGARIPRRRGSCPARDDYVAYLQEYSAGMRLRLGTRVHRIDRTDHGWALALEAGSLTAAHAVIATGSEAEPVLPDWPGLASFGGTVIHAGQFRNVAAMAGRDVLVVGPGNSGVDLLGYLAASDAGRLWPSARSGMTVTPRRLGGVPLHPASVALRRLPVRWQDGTARAGDVDDARAGRHDLGGRLGHPVGAHQVDVDDLAELLGGLAQRGHGRTHPGVVDEHVEMAEPPDGRLYQRPARVRVGDVGLHGQRGPAQALDRAAGGVQAVPYSSWARSRRTFFWICPGPATTTMSHPGAPDHGNATSSWLRSRAGALFPIAPRPENSANLAGPGA